jgi:hypothetical protein
VQVGYIISSLISLIFYLKVRLNYQGPRLKRCSKMQIDAVRIWQNVTLALDMDCDACYAGLYAVTPEAGMLPGGSNQQFTLRFSPQEVEDVSRTIMCHMPVLEQLAATAAGPAADASRQLTREVTGKVRNSVL